MCHRTLMLCAPHFYPTEDLTHFTYGGMPRRIASVEEVLALKPELRRAD